MWVHVCVSECAHKCRLNLNGASKENHANTPLYINKEVGMFMQGAICGRQGLG